MAIQKIAEQKNKANLEAQQGPGMDADHTGPKQTVGSILYSEQINITEILLTCLYSCSRS